MKTYESSSKLGAMQEEDGDDDNTLDSSGSSSRQHPTSNLVAPDSLKRRTTVDGVSAAMSKDQQINNEREVTIDDYIKDSVETESFFWDSNQSKIFSKIGKSSAVLDPKF